VGRNEAGEVPKPRRKVTAAKTTLERVRIQRENFDTEYGKATTAQARFAAASNALRAAAAAGRHQPHSEEVGRRLDVLTERMKQLLDALHQEQESKGEKVIRADQRRIARNERRRG
jgi:hypothetical protein